MFSVLQVGHGGGMAKPGHVVPPLLIAYAEAKSAGNGVFLGLKNTRKMLDGAENVSQFMVHQGTA